MDAKLYNKLINYELHRYTLTSNAEEIVAAETGVNCGFDPVQRRILINKKYQHVHGKKRDLLFYRELGKAIAASLKHGKDPIYYEVAKSHTSLVAEKVVDENVVDENVVDENVVDEKVVDENVVAEKVIDENVGAENVGAENVGAENVGAENVVDENVVTNS